MSEKRTVSQTAFYIGYEIAAVNCRRGRKLNFCRLFHESCTLAVAHARDTTYVHVGFAVSYGVTIAEFFDFKDERFVIFGEFCGSHVVCVVNTQSLVCSRVVVEQCV